MRRLFIGVLVVAAALLAACAPIQTPTAAPPAAAQPEPVTIESAADVPRISVEEAKVHFDNGTAVFVDSRGRRFYDMQHIAGAMPPPEVDPPALDNSIPKDQLIIAYCT